MNRFLCFVSIIFISCSGMAKTLVVSDIDDTIRSLHVRTNYIELFDHATDSRRAFRGMREIFKSWDGLGAKIYYVSAVVEPFVGYSEEFLSYNQFPQRENFYYKGWFEDTYDFKLQQIIDIIDDEKPDTIILLGDNADKDVVVYEQIYSRYKSVNIFIHKVYPGQIPPQQDIYLTGADLAAKLTTKQLLPAPTAEKVMTEIHQDLMSGDAFVIDMVWPNWGTTNPQDIEMAFSVIDDSKNDLEILMWIKEELFPKSSKLAISYDKF